MSASGWRWWSWDDGVAHARRYRARGQAACGAKLHPLACYASGPISPCPQCVEAIARSDGSQPQPPTCTWCGLPVVGARVEVRRDATGQTHTLHPACVALQADWERALTRSEGTP